MPPGAELHAHGILVEVIGAFEVEPGDLFAIEPAGERAVRPIAEEDFAIAIGVQMGREIRERFFVRAQQFAELERAAEYLAREAAPADLALLPLIARFEIEILLDRLRARETAA